MKKFILSTVVIISFVVYCIYAKVTGAGTPVLLTPKQANIPTNTPSSTGTDTPSPASDSGSNTTPTQLPTDTPTPTANSKYKDGSYTGSTEDAFYGNIQVQATISSGKITHIKFLQFPNDRSTSVFINNQADPQLAQEAIQAQSANVEIVSGATDSSQAFIQSMQTALNQAQ